jgi:hypothetical protein
LPAGIRGDAGTLDGVPTLWRLDVLLSARAFAAEAVENVTGPAMLPKGDRGAMGRIDRFLVIDNTQSTMANGLIPSASPGWR